MNSSIQQNMYVIYSVELDDVGNTVFKYESVSFRLDYAIDYFYRDTLSLHVKFYKRPITEEEYNERKIANDVVVLLCKRNQCPPNFSGFCIEEVPALYFDFRELLV